MNVTVADCLKLPTLREAQLIAGAKGTDRAVSSVSVLEWPETNLLSDELIVGNELVISALVTIKDDVSRQCSVLRHLRSMGAAGLVLFYVGVFIPQIDDALIAVADEINLPLIAMPFGRMDFRYSDMITDISFASRRKDVSCSTGSVCISLRSAFGNAQPSAGLRAISRCSTASFRAEEMI